MSRSQTPSDAAPKSCRQCSEDLPEAMTRRGLCYECTRVQDFRRPIENHHPFGRYNGAVEAITVEIPGNWHRVLNARANERPPILKRPGDNPLHQIASAVAALGEAVATFADFARRQQWPEWAAKLADRFAAAADSASTWLLVLAGRLDDRLGPEWRRDLDLPLWEI
jgi:hypothetical protein